MYLCCLYLPLGCLHMELIMPEEAVAVQNRLLEAVEFPSYSENSATASQASFLTSPTKRALDITGALFILALLLPLLVFVGLAIVASSRGGALFRQRRYGRNGTVFSIYKFRSMRAAADVAFLQAVRGDSRVTFVGRIIRKTSIDEIPQLFNVLKGEMSLVGPRPHPLELDDRYRPDILGYDIRFRAPPGMTGLAQVSGARGGTPTVEHMRRRIAFDARYVRDASLLLDLKILALTARELLFAFSDENAF